MLHNIINTYKQAPFTMGDLDSGSPWMKGAENRNYEMGAAQGKIDMGGTYVSHEISRIIFSVPHIHTYIHTYMHT